MTKEKIQCTNCNHENLIKVSKKHRFNYPMTLVGYFLVAAAIAGLFLSWTFLSKILSHSVANGFSFIVQTLLFTFSLTVIAGISGLLLATKKKVLKLEN